MQRHAVPDELLRRIIYMAVASTLMGTRANPLCRLPAFNVEIH